MQSDDDALAWFTPLPPARNGIADYSAMLLREMARLIPCRVYCEEPLAEAPDGVEVGDPLQAFRQISAKSSILHQIGNNPGHVFVLDALRRFGGVATLHDLSLLYVHEISAQRMVDIFGRMQNPAPSLGATFARHWKHHGIKTAANYVLFDMVGDVLSQSSRVIVHSEYARKKLAACYGGAAADKIDVIPHFAKALRTSRAEARARLGIGRDEILLLTSGFATRAKRFDWLIEALDQLRQHGRNFRFIHAGQERASEYSLTGAINARPNLAACSSVTGYLPEDDLDNHIAAADIIINLRFPSVGESSGTLARAFAAGRCCLVNDTAAYAEIPRDAVVHIPVFDAVNALARALDHLLRDADLRDSFGERARQYARRHLSIRSIARQYIDTLQAGGGREASVHRPPAAEPLTLTFDIADELPDLSEVLPPTTRKFDITFWFDSAEHLAETTMRRPGLVQAAAGSHVDIESMRFVAESGQRIGLNVAGWAGG